VVLWAGQQAKAQGKGEVACGGPKTEDGPKLTKKFLLNFKLKLGIWLDFGNLHKQI
jgi:hypothetical protein